MGLLDGLLGEVVGSLAGGGGAAAGNAGSQQASLATSLLHMMAGQQGGLGGLVQNFEKAGLGKLMQGWISTGPNPTPTAEDVQKGLGQTNLQALSAKTGLSMAALLPLLVQVLPVLIDKMTPQGKLPPAPAPGAAAAAGGDPLGALLGSLLGGLGR